jgi:hypothetical protein
MQNPFRSEAEAYRFVLVSVAYFAAIVAAATIGGVWAGVAVFVLATAAVGAWILFTGKRERPPQVAPPRRHSEDERRILVIANETVSGSALRATIREKAEGFQTSKVHVVAPALNSPVRHWASDEDPARRAAEQRLQASLDRLRAGGIDASGQVGDSEPLQAIEDGLRLFDADEIVISTHPEGRSNWLEKGVVAAARERFAVPVTHVVVDLDAEREEVR